MTTTLIPEHPENFGEERELQNVRERDPKPKYYTTQQILKLAEDLKTRVTGFMHAAYRNKETTNMVDYDIVQAFLFKLDNSIDQIKAINPENRDV